MIRPFLALLPCGCSIDPDRMQLHYVFGSPSFENAVICCPWCDATFSAIEYRDWIHEPGREVVIQFRAQVIIQSGRVLEVVGLCGRCGSLMVREPCAKEVVHLETGVPVQMLRN